MRTYIPEQLQAIINDVDAGENVPTTRLMVLSEWFAFPGRLPAFGLWLARWVAGHKGKACGEVGVLLRDASFLLGTASTRESYFQQIHQESARKLCDRARELQTVSRSRQLSFLEKGLALHLRLIDSPSDGCELVSQWARDGDACPSESLSKRCRGKLSGLLRFMFGAEALEDEG